MTRLEALAERLDSGRYTRKTLADGSGIVLDLEKVHVLSLNRTGMFVLEEIAGGATDQEGLERRIVDAFDVDSETATTDLEELLDELDRLLAAPNEPCDGC